MDNYLGQSILTQALVDPDTVIDKYKAEAIKAGTQLALVHVVAYSLLTYFIVDAVVRRYK